MRATKASITGVVLAGGRARRMGGEDKGLLPFRGQPLVSYVLEGLKSQTDNVLINANRNLDEYAAFGYPVIQDGSETFDGPLAGLLSAMRAASTPYVLIVPCDAPLINGDLLARLIHRFNEGQDEEEAELPAELCAAHDGERLHPVFLLAETRLADDLSAYLASGERKVQLWLHRHRLVFADYSDRPEVFANLNTPDDVAALKVWLAACQQGN